MDYTNTQHMFTNKEILKRKVVVFGISDLAELAHYYLTNDSPYEIVAFTVNKEYLLGTKIIKVYCPPIGYLK